MGEKNKTKQPNPHKIKTPKNKETNNNHHHTKNPQKNPKQTKKTPNLNLFTFLHALYCNFILFGYFGEVGLRITFIALQFPLSFGGSVGEMFYPVCQLVDIFDDLQKGKSDISKPCYISYVIPQKNCLAFIAYQVSNSKQFV